MNRRLGSPRQSCLLRANAITRCCLAVCCSFVCWCEQARCVQAWGAETEHSSESAHTYAPAIQLEASGVELKLIAEHPDVVTPTGIDVDDQGSLWVIANHTHFRPDDYNGPKHDQILVFHQDGRRSVFYDQTNASMDLKIGLDGWIYVAQRDRILRIRDSNGDGRGDLTETIATLDSEADYPHNGLSGLAWSTSGELIFALGENFAKPWTLTGSDGSKVLGSGEGGIFRCDARGGSLTRIARGFWNPFGLCVRDDGEMFAAENDPGSRPPCRLLHIVSGGDYGYQRRYGNDAYHPFVCWNGELPGTLPMLHTVGEAPCGIAPLGNGLILTSWTEHRIDFYPLHRQGASFKTERITLVRGGDHFRPTCVTAASATQFYLTDWVVGSYEIHGKGRIWKLSIDPNAADWLGDQQQLEPVNDMTSLAGALRLGGEGMSIEQLVQFCGNSDPFVRSAAIKALSTRTAIMNPEAEHAFQGDDLISLLLAKRQAQPKDGAAPARFLNHADPSVQFEAMRWIADEELTQFLPEIHRRLADPQIPFRLFEAALATSNALSGNPEAGVADPKMLLSLLQQSDNSPRVRAFALRLVDPQHRGFSPQLWNELLGSGEPEVITELVRSVAIVGSPDASEFLLRIAMDQTHSDSIRADAASGVSAASEQNLHALLSLAESDQPLIRDATLRSLRFAKLGETEASRLRKIEAAYPAASDLVQAVLDPASLNSGRPDASDVLAWRQRLDAVPQPVNLDEGRRLFHHASVAACFKCHRRFGRGSDLGPDLSASSHVDDGDRLLRSLLQPSRDVDPQYHPRLLVTDDGQVFTGILLRDGGGGQEFYRDSAGREKLFNTSEIVQRKELNTSMMPDGLFEQMTDREIRDLIAYLEGGKNTNLVSLSTNPWIGSWWLDFEDGYGGWLEVTANENDYAANLLWRVGSARPISITSINDQKLVMTRNNRNGTSRYVASMQGDHVQVRMDGSDKIASGSRCPPMPPRPDSICKETIPAFATETYRSDQESNAPNRLLHDR